MASRLLRWFDAAVAAGLLVGAMVHSTMRDAWTATSLIFYATPWPVLALAGLWLSWRWRHFRRVWIAPLIMALGALAIWIAKDWQVRPPSHADKDLRVVHWNVARPVLRLPYVVRQLRAYDADIIAIAEAMPKTNSTMTRWQTEFPDYKPVFAFGEMLCLVRGELQHQQSGVLGPASFYTALDVTIKGRACTILQVDLIATPWRSRRLPLQQLATLVAARSDRSLIVLGDFNTPRDSVLFAPLRAHVTHAWEQAGIGCAETWPMPVPILSLDHIWLGGLQAVRCEHSVSCWSDHRPVVVDVAWPKKL
jgi:vancomycin resistance protein VanJ